MSAQQVARRSAIVVGRQGTTRAQIGLRFLMTGLLLADLGAFVLAVAMAYVLRFKTGLPGLETPPHRIAFYLTLSLWESPAWLVIFGLSRLYDYRSLFSGVQEYIRIINACTLGIVVVILTSFIDKDVFVSRGWLILVWALSIFFVCAERFGIRRLLRTLRTRGMLTIPTIVLGANEEGRALAEQFLSDPSSGVRVVGFVDDSLRPGSTVVDGLVVLGGLEDVECIRKEHDVAEIVVASTAVSRHDLLGLFQTFGHREDVEIRLSSGLFEILTTGVLVQEVSNVSLLSPQRIRIVGIDAALKTVLDYAGALGMLVVLSPLWLVVAVLVKVDSPGPILYRRRVLGRSGKPFDALKFRTMVVDSDRVLAADEALRASFEQGYKLKEDPRVTRVGRVIRRMSLDELPQLINVLRGEMSLVGPRMIAPEEIVRYGKWQLNLLTVKPGLTGPWQVVGRSDIPYEDRVQLSMQYIRNYSVWVDLAILLRTVPAVLSARGAY
jgi:exopolysaccharide biosynthesis polyprenyl glycosylphosphotransferase